METKDKIYILTWWYCGKGEEKAKGSPAFCMTKKLILEREKQYKVGKFTIISESGLKYSSQYIKP